MEGTWLDAGLHRAGLKVYSARGAAAVRGKSEARRATERMLQITSEETQAGPTQPALRRGNVNLELGDSPFLDALLSHGLFQSLATCRVASPAPTTADGAMWQLGALPLVVSVEIAPVPFVFPRYALRVAPMKMDAPPPFLAPPPI